MATDFKFGSPEHLEAQRTDDVWSAELQRLFGKRAGDVRYTPHGKGEPGSALRVAYDAREAARKATGHKSVEKPANRSDHVSRQTLVFGILLSLLAAPMVAVLSSFVIPICHHCK